MKSGETIRGKPVYGLTGDWDSVRAGTNNVRSQLDSGMRHDTSDNVITYAFFNHKHALGLNNHPGFGEGAGYAPFTEAQKTAARLAVRNWDELIATKIVESPVTASRNHLERVQGSIPLGIGSTYTYPAAG